MGGPLVPALELCAVCEGLGMWLRVEWLDGHQNSLPPSGSACDLSHSPDCLTGGRPEEK